MKRSFGTNLTNVAQTSSHSNQPFSHLQNPSVVTHKPSPVTSHVVKPKPVFSCVQHDPFGIQYEPISTFQNIEYVESLPVSNQSQKTNCQVTPLVRLRKLPNILKRNRRSSSSSSMHVPTTPTEVSLNMTPIVDIYSQKKSIKIERTDSIGSATPKNRKSRLQGSNPHEKPPYSYMAMIQFAIESAGEIGKMTLKDIYEYIETKFPYFKYAKPGWKNSVRHNLSLHSCFVRESPAPNSKTSYWCIKQTSNNPTPLLNDYDEFGRKPEKQRRKERHVYTCGINDNNKENIPPFGYQRLPNYHPNNHPKNHENYENQEIVLRPVDADVKTESPERGVGPDSFDAIVDRFICNEDKPNLSLRSNDSFTMFINELGSPFANALTQNRRSEKKRKRSLQFDPKCSSTPALNKAFDNGTKQLGKSKVRRAIVNELEQNTELSSSPINQAIEDAKDDLVGFDSFIFENLEE